MTPTDRTGQFDVVVDGEVIAGRGGNAFSRIVLGAGFPEPAAVLADLESRGASPVS